MNNDSTSRLPPQDDDPESSESVGGRPTESATPPADSSGSFEIEASAPARIGRFEIVRQLGKGGYGFVYLAKDPSLKRQVAVKVPRWDKPLSGHAMDRFLHEGRMLAQVNHPSIVTVYDVGLTEDGIPFVVMEYIQGRSLSEIVKNRELDLDQSLSILMKIAVALREAHRKSIVHRDLKPSNVIIDEDGKTFLVDFGLALHDDLKVGITEEGGALGTLAFMAPEQVRGENHRIDGQTDVWAFGVTMYLMLVGKMPFRGKLQELQRAICYRNPKPLRQLNDKVSRELERICLRCLQKLMDERYQSMADLIEELESAIFLRISEASHAQQLSGQTVSGLSRVDDSPSGGHPSRGDSSIPGRSDSLTSGTSPSEPLYIVPKGLRPFDQNDAEFFLRLLPGPTDRHGVPESIRFWSSRLDTRDQVEDVPVGLIYGPSGCGKSSFVRAGLIPRLSNDVIPVYVDCTTDNLEQQIVRRINREIHNVNPEGGLSETLREIRLGEQLQPGDKLLLVLDQFEQWLHSCTNYAEQELTEALRHCDSQRVQCLLLVRDDFWMSVSQLMRCLEQRIEEGKNAYSLPLFDERHARYVLEAYGRANQDLPRDERLSRNQKQFVRSAVDTLSKNGKVICVHLAVFAAMMKGRDWTVQRLKSMGGWEGIGREFLNEIFDECNVPRHQKSWEPAARRILGALLPPASTVIKGQMRSAAELKSAAELNDDRETFESVMKLLTIDSNLVSAVDMHENESTSQPESRNLHGHYQLTHDFLVAPIRSWLEFKKRATWQGRAELRFSELANQWERQPDARFLPSFAEQIGFMRGLKLHFKQAHREFWSAAKRHWLKRVVATVVLAAIAGLAVFMLFDLNKRQIAIHQAERVLNIHPAAFIEASESIESRWRHVKDYVASVAASERSTGRQMLHAQLLSAMMDENDSSVIPIIAKAIRNAEPLECQNIVHALRPWGVQATNILRDQFNRSADELEKSRLAIVLWFLHDLSAVNKVAAELEDPELRTSFVREFGSWHGDLSTLLPQLVNYVDSSDPLYLGLACLALGQIDPERLAEAVREQSSTFIRQVFLDPRSGGAHSAAEWAWLQWHPEPIPVNSEINQLPDNAWQQGWFRVAVQTNNGRFDLDFVRIEPGKFTRGTGVPESARGRTRNPIDVQEVRMAEPYYVCTTEVSQALIAEFINQLPDDDVARRGIDEIENPSRHLPAVNVDWWVSARFCNWLSQQFRLDLCYAKDDQDSLVFNPGVVGISLPNSDQWEFACRGGSNQGHPFGDLHLSQSFSEYTWIELGFDVGDIASGGELKGKMPNAYGLYNMIGNVAEWCNDQSEFDFGQGQVIKEKTVRGGNNSSTPHNWLSGYFYNAPPEFRKGMGIRLVICPFGKNDRQE